VDSLLQVKLASASAGKTAAAAQAKNRITRSGTNACCHIVISLLDELLEAAAVDAEVEQAYRAMIERSVDAIAEGIVAGRLGEVPPREVARALSLMNGHYLLDAFDREPRVDPAVALEALWTIWTGALGMEA
jgi:hypothetical protein